MLHKVSYKATAKSDVKHPFEHGLASSIIANSFNGALYTNLAIPNSVGIAPSKFFSLLVGSVRFHFLRAVTILALSKLGNAYC
jgi:hypothetical protein